MNELSKGGYILNIVQSQQCDKQLGVANKLIDADEAKMQKTVWSPEQTLRDAVEETLPPSVVFRNIELIAKQWWRESISCGYMLSCLRWSHRRETHFKLINLWLIRGENSNNQLNDLCLG